MSKVIPWVLVFGLSVLSLVQRQTISSLENQKVEFTSDTNSKSEISQRAAGISKSTKTNIPSYGNDKTTKTTRPKRQQHQSYGSPDVTNVPSNDMESSEMDALIEERAWQRVAEIEEERQQERIDFISEKISERVGDLAVKQGWSEEIQQQMETILINSMQDRMELRQQMKDGLLERDDYRQQAEAIRDSRDAQVIDTLGEDEFLSIEEELQPRRGPPR